MKSVWIESFLLLVLFGLVSCTSNVNDKNSQNEASTFEVVSLTPISVSSVSSDEKWTDLKDQVTVDLRACLKDRVYQQLIVGDTFEIETELSSHSKTSNTSGCISWKEKFNFDSTADETFYSLDGRITNTTNYLGEYHFKLAINPWTSEVYYLNVGGTPTKITSLNNIGVSTLEKKLQIKNYELSVTNYKFDDRKAEVSFKFLTTPILIKKKIDDTKDNSTKFSSGTFDLKFDLFQRLKGTNKRILISQTESTVNVNADGKLESNINFEIESKIQNDATIELVARAIPVDKEEILGTDEGYCVISSLVTPAIGEFSRLPKQYDTMLVESDTVKHSKEFTIENEQSFQHGFLIDGIIANLPGLEVGQNMNAATMDNKLQTSISISIIDSLVFEGIRSEFRVKLQDLKTNEVIYDQYVDTKKRKGSGVLVIDPVIEYGENFEYDYRNYKISITGVDGPFEGITRDRIVYINPRVRASNFLIDSEDGRKPELASENNPEIYFDQVGFEFIRNDEDFLYSVNKNLDLLNKRVVRLTIYPKQKMDHNFNGRDNGYPPLMTGSLDVTFMLFSPKKLTTQSYDKKLDLKDFYVITADKVENVQITGGRIQVDVSLPHLFDQRLLMSYKNIAVVQLKSSKEDSIIRPGYMVGPVEIFKKFGVIESYLDSRLQDAQTVNLVQSNEELISLAKDHIVDYQERLEKDSDISDRYEEFKKVILSDEGKKEVMIFDPIAPGIKKAITEYHVYDSEIEFEQKNKGKIKNAVLTKLLNQHIFLEKSEKAELCSLFYNPNEKREVSIQGGMMPIVGEKVGEMYQACRSNPKQFIDIVEMDFIHKITKQPAELREELGKATAVEDTRNLMRNEAHFMTRGQMFQDVEGERDSVAYILGLHKFASFFGVELGRRVDHFNMSTVNDILSKQRRIINQDGQNFLVTTVDVTFEAEFKKCMMLIPKWVNVKRPTYTEGGFLSVVNYLKATFTDYEDEIHLTSNQRHIICKNFREKRELEDSWYFVRLAHYHQDQDVDNSMAKNTVGTVFRGKKTYDQYRLVGLDNDEKIIVRTDSDEEIAGRYRKYMDKNGKSLKYKERLGIGFPGLFEPISSEEDAERIKSRLKGIKGIKD